MRICGPERRDLAAAATVIIGAGVAILVWDAHRRIGAQRYPQHENRDRELDQPQQQKKQPERHLTVDATASKRSSQAPTRGSAGSTRARGRNTQVAGLFWAITLHNIYYRA